jgi:hypothetical protein
MNISGKTRIFKNEKGLYTTISNKKDDGTYENMYISVNFKKGIELENNTEINITKAFLSFYKTKDGLPKLKIVVMEYTTDADEQYKQDEREAIQNESNYNFPDDEMPF